MYFFCFFFFSSRRRHTRSVSAFLLNRSSDLTLQAGTSAVSDKLLDLVGLGGKSAADKGKDTRDYLAAAFPELNAWERAGADASSAGMVDAGFENQKELTKKIGRASCRERVEISEVGRGVRGIEMGADSDGQTGC